MYVLCIGYIGKTGIFTQDCGSNRAKKKAGHTGNIEGHIMGKPSERFWQILIEVFEALPRQGPGNRACTQRALALCRDLPPVPKILDLGSGIGAQSLHLAELTAGIRRGGISRVLCYAINESVGYE